MSSMGGETTADALAGAERFGQTVRGGIAAPTLTEFLLACIAEDEADAYHARGLLGMETEWHTVEHLRERGLSVADARHVERWSSTRVLAECAAKRRIIELHEHAKVRPDPTDEFDFGCWRCHHDRDYGVLAEGWCDTVRALALPYADHPDYREEWRP